MPLPPNWVEGASAQAVSPPALRQQKFVRSAGKCPTQFSNYLESGPGKACFELGNVGPIDPRKIGKLFLRNAFFVPKAAKVCRE